MKLNRNRNKLKILIPIASMGDIAFLLIIFFMLTSNFIKEAHVDLTPATSPDIERLKQAPISVSMDKEGILWLQGEIVNVEGLSGLVDGLLEGKSNQDVNVRIHNELVEEQFRPVLMALSKSGASINLTGTKIK